MGLRESLVEETAGEGLWAGALLPKANLTGESFAVSRNWPALGEAALQVQGPKCQSIKNTEHKKIQSIRRRIHRVEYYSTLKRKGTATHVTAWMTLKALREVK